MSKTKITLYDTTLRDGAQTSGVDFTLQDKQTILRMLDDLGLNYIEAGYPGANPLDTEFFENLPQTQNKICAFGMTKRHGRSASNDAPFQTTISSNAQTITLVAKTWDYHVHEALGITLDENLESLSQSIEHIKALGKEAIIDCEHFFDGYKAKPEYALKCVQCAHNAGANWVVLCDTNGGTLPAEIAAAIDHVKQVCPDVNLGIHTHNDTGHAIANSLIAIAHGATQIQGTLNGLGERCGNADLVTLIPILLLKSPYKEQFEISVAPEKLKSLSQISRKFDEIINRAPNRYAPFVGENAFAHKGGIHASAVLKNPDMYEHIPPESVGNTRQILVSDQAGKSNIIAQLKSVGLELDSNDNRIHDILREIKQRENMGYAYEAADASFKLLALRALDQVPNYFTVEKFNVTVERRNIGQGAFESVAEAVVKVKIGDQSFITAAEGNGPVNALDLALRKDLGIYQPFIEDLKLTDYKVRILNGGTQAITRVLLESTDANQQKWTTIGVSSNIIDASFEALMESILYKLINSGAKTVT